MCSMSINYFSTKSDITLPHFCKHHPITPESILVDTKKSIEIALSTNIHNTCTHFIPSLTLLQDEGYSFQFSITSDKQQNPIYLAPCGESNKEFYDRYKSNEKSPVATPDIDLIKFLKPISNLTLTVCVKSHENINLKNLKVFISSFSNQEKKEYAPIDPIRLSIPSFSQMSQNNDIKNRICSPSSTNMVLNYFNTSGPFNELLSDMYNAEENMYGIWPQAVYAASKRKVQGFVGYINDTNEISTLLKSGLPIIASIQHQGDLPGSPLAKTSGHLVVITGINRDFFFVNDPAIDAESVAIKYPRKEFLNSWSKSSYAYYCLFK